jgi:hypothetical protein
MNQFKPLSSTSAAIAQYWQLINTMLFNFKTIGYVFVFFLSIAFIAALIVLFFADFYTVSAVVISLSLFILVFIGVIALPIGMLVLLCNRHISAMADIRNKLFVITCIFCLFASLLISTSPVLIKKELFSFSVAVYVFLSCVLYFWLAIYICSKRSEFLSVAFFAMITWINISYEALVVLHPIVLLLITLFTLVLFYRWWVSFSPKLSRVNSSLVKSGVEKMQEIHPVGYLGDWFHLLSNRIKTPVGSMLLGCGDSIASFIKPLIAIYLTSLAFSFFICKGFVGWQFTDNAFSATIIALGYSFLISVICLPAKNMLMNVRRGWLVFEGNRSDLFLYLEAKFFKGLSTLVVFNFILIIALVLVGNRAHYTMYCIGALLGLSVLAILMFYAEIYFYKRGKLASGDINLFKTAVNIVCFVPLVFYLVFKHQTFNVFEVGDAIAVGVVLLVLMCLKTVRLSAMQKWQKADF